MKTRLLLTLLLTILSKDVYSHCHNFDLIYNCERVHRDFISGDKWDNIGSPQKVRYWIGQYDLPGQPSLRNGDVNWSADQWSDINFNNQTTKFRYIHAGTTHRPIPWKDATNYIDWGTPTNIHQVAETTVFLDPYNNDKIIEVDMVFNYHKTFKAHSDTSNTTGHCIRNVAAHEFGHGLGLWHRGSSVCPSYAAYTMTADIKPPNTHSHEYLECEDKYMAWYVYNVMGPPVHDPNEHPDPEVQWRRRMEGGQQAPVLTLPAARMDNTSGIPSESRLYQNYPSPFNPETWIPYELNKDTQLVLSIGDATGHRIKTIELGKVSAGRYLTKDKAIHWDGKNEKGEHVSSGVYYYTLKGDHFLYTGKMMLVK